MYGSNYVSMVILMLDTTASKEIIFARDLSLKTLQRVNFLGCGVVVVLVPSVFVCPNFLFFITGLDVLDNIFVSDGAYGWECVQKDPSWVNNDGSWLILRGLVHGESQLYWLQSNVSVGWWLWVISCVMSCLLTEIACDFWEWYPIVTWYYLVVLCITTLDKHD